LGGLLPEVDLDLGVQADVGMIDSRVNSQGVEGAAEDVYSRAQTSLAEVSVLGNELDLPYAAEQTALPQSDEWETTPLEIDGSDIFDARVFSGRVKANWDEEFVVPETSSYAETPGGLTPEMGGPLAIVDDSAGEVNLGLPGSPLVGVDGLEMQTEQGTIPNGDGTSAAYSQISGSFGGVDILGGADGGGISIGAAPGSGTSNPVLIRAVATGKEGE
ncbi:hypothetical protein, partial [Phytoactinopolyspora endophytica]|uniref:hypothetical protein n=1 Tax=Phytoactinopolyspora endophytica TaxID=1642495 RepID=UPI0013EAFACD